MIFKNSFKGPLATLAVNSTIFNAGCLFFWPIVLCALINEFIRQDEKAAIYESIRTQKQQQHIEQQLKHNQMIQLIRFHQQQVG